MSDGKQKPKIGAGHASAMARLGLAELRAAFVNSDSNIVQPSPYGIFGTKTPGEVQEERKSRSSDAGDEPQSAHDDRRDAKRACEDQDREPPEPEME